MPWWKKRIDPNCEDINTWLLAWAARMKNNAGTSQQIQDMNDRFFAIADADIDAAREGFVDDSTDISASYARVFDAEWSSDPPPGAAKCHRLTLGWLHYLERLFEMVVEGYDPNDGEVLDCQKHIDAFRDAAIHEARRLARQCE